MPPLVSVTVAVQVVAFPCTTEAGLQFTLVLVARLTVRAKFPLLTAWVVSPGYEAVRVCDPVAVGV